MKRLLIVFLIVAGLPLYANPAAVSIMNDMRADKRRAPLTYSVILEKAADMHARDMAENGFFSHSSQNGASVGDRVKTAGYQWCFLAENIAQGQTSLSQVMAGWASSPGHYKNMMHKKAAQFGLAQGPGNTWVMVLAAPC
jgi:uncharacterized protein YkwD